MCYFIFHIQKESMFGAIAPLFCQVCQSGYITIMKRWLCNRPIILVSIQDSLPAISLPNRQHGSSLRNIGECNLIRKLPLHVF